MGRIDNETVRKILDTANIVDVVSDFVSLKRSGSGYKGLCPFHNERTPSFSVSPARNMCKCFSCGKGGSPVGFIMELEQMTYVEALKYLAKKYNIPVEERELTDSERQQATRRESMFAVNDFALKHFRLNLTATADGRDIGLAYFRHRGISDAMIERFGLGYALDYRDGLFRAATAAGFDKEWLLATGLCSQNERGIYDRFRGRVTYPVYTVSGKVVAFGARTLRSDKNIAKYVNSPESDIYHKSNELYGLYQAKKAIVANDKCILVEGYMDVISMHQAGVENVVASSGTSLTDEQIRLIHRFTDNVTVIYDSDPAGIKASLRGIDMLLAERLNIKVLLLPQGDDPDSFAQAHSHDEVVKFIDDNETDFIHFKTHILLDEAKDDPVQRSRVIADIVRSIANISNEITRTVYIQQCAGMFRMPEDVLTREVSKAIIQLRESRRPRVTGGGQHPATSAGSDSTLPPDDLFVEDAQADTGTEAGDVESAQTSGAGAATPPAISGQQSETEYLREAELVLLQLILRFGMTQLSDFTGGDSGSSTVLQVITRELSDNNITLTNDDIRETLQTVVEYVRDNWERDYAHHLADNDRQRERQRAEGEESISATATDLSQIKRLTSALDTLLDEDYRHRLDDFRDNYISKALLSHPDDRIRGLANTLIPHKHHLSRIHSRHARVETERDRLNDNVPKAVYLYQYQILMYRISQLRARLRDCTDATTLRDVMSKLTAYNKLKMEFASYLGERVLAAKS